MLAHRIAFIVLGSTMLFLNGCETVPAAFNAVGQGVDSVAQGMRGDASSMQQGQGGLTGAVRPDPLADSADLYGPGWGHIDFTDPDLNPPVIYNTIPHYQR